MNLKKMLDELQANPCNDRTRNNIEKVFAELEAENKRKTEALERIQHRASHLRLHEDAVVRSDISLIDDTCCAALEESHE